MNMGTRNFKVGWSSEPHRPCPACTYTRFCCSFFCLFSVKYVYALAISADDVLSTYRRNQRKTTHQPSLLMYCPRIDERHDYTHQPSLLMYCPRIDERHDYAPAISADVYCPRIDERHDYAPVISADVLSTYRRKT